MTSSGATRDDVSDDDDDDDEGYDGHVIVSASIFSPVVLPALAPYQSEAKRGGWIYQLGMTTFEEPHSEPRADRLRATIHHYLDVIGRVPREDLHHPEAFVRIYMTLPRGAETIHADTVKRLADANATVWIDA